MSGNIIEFSNAVNSAIQAGTAIEGTAVRVLADNGAEIGQAVTQEIAAGGGAGATIYTLTQSAGAANVATGVSLLALELPTAAAGIAACLGVVAGFGLYNLAPEFWTNVSNALVNAGKTIGGKIVSYWDGQNTYYDRETIEIIKNALVDLGVFDMSDPVLPPTQTTGQTTITGRIHPLELLDYAISINPRVINIGAVYDSIVNFINTYWTPNKICTIDMTTVTSSYGGWSPLNIIISNNEYPNNTSITLGSGEFTSHGFQTYGSGGAGQPIILTSGRYSALGISFMLGVVNGGGRLKYSNINVAEGEPTSGIPLQDGATYPDEQPFPPTYPTWIPYPFLPTLPDPSELPDIYPVKYPSIEPDPYPLQEPAQNPDPENIPTIYPNLIPNFDLPNPFNLPTQEPQIDPDAQPKSDPIAEPNTDTPTIPDPLDPNPVPTPSIPIVIPNLPTTVSSNKLFTVYNPTAAQLDALGGYLWDGSIIASIRDIWQDPLDGIISLIQVFVTPTTSGSHNIILGFLDSGVSSAVVSNQFVTVDCGSVTIDENKQNATDYAPYTSIHLYLPFIGFVELDTNEVMNSEISVKYQVDVYTGTCLAQISVERTADMPDDPILYTYSGNCSQQIPLTSGNATGVLSSLIGGITAGLAVASGGGLGIMTGAQVLGNSLTHEMFHVNHSSNISANAGIMGLKKPYIIIGRRHGYDANNYSKYYGFPVNKTVILNNHSGYVRVKKCLLQTTATAPEYDEILSLLNNGVIL